MANDAQLSAQGGVIITGASSGIGMECALYLDRRGYRVFAGVRKASDAEVLTKAASPRLSPVIVDVTDAKSVSDASRQVAEALGAVPLVGLVNNAGIGLGGPVEFLAPAELRRQMEVNLVGPLAVIQAFMPMLRRSRGRIVNISSIGGKVATPFLSAYCASKFALEALSDCLRAELKPWGIEVSIVEPGAVKTRIFEKARGTVDDVLRALPPDGVRYYGPEIDVMRNLIAMQERSAVPAERVAKVVEHALTARRPHARYLVGFDAKLLASLHWMLSARAFDGVFAMFKRRFGGGQAAGG
jgi:NAD(P)-dependent dehydrogenase (short-subunit alcohol dehydrogenase family)